MVDLGGFDANVIEPIVPLEAIPSGKYLAIISASEQKATKDEKGWFLELKLQIVEGEYKGRNVFDRLNLSNPNPVAMKMANGTLSAICRALGVMQPKDSVELHDLPMTITVKCAPRKDNGEMSNEVKGYASKSDVAGEPQQQPGNKAPWAQPIA